MLRPLASAALVTFAALSTVAHAQPRTAVTPPDAASVERWIRRACGVGGPADAAWAASHVRAPVTLDVCQGEARRRCRRTRERDAASAVRLACEVDLVDMLRSGSPHPTLAAWDAEAYGARLRARGRARRVAALVGQFSRVLVLIAGPDGEAILTAIDDR